MNDSTTMFRVLSARRTALPLTALLAISTAAQPDALRDPTRPATARAATQAVAPDALQLEAIMNAGPQRVAIVNGKLVRIGDRIGSALIEEIGTESIRYTRGGHSIVARITRTGMQVRNPVAAGEER